jgi:hypothetical protein
MALDQDRIAPQTQPNRAAFEKVMTKAGRGAIRDWKTMSRNETIGAKIPKDRMYSFMAGTSTLERIAVACLTTDWTGGTNKYRPTAIRMMPIFTQTELASFPTLL